MKGKNYNLLNFKLFLILVLFLVLISDCIIAKEAEFSSVQATILEEMVVRGNPYIDEGQARNISCMPENPEDYLPMPFPEYANFENVHESEISDYKEFISNSLEPRLALSSFGVPDQYCDRLGLINISDKNNEEYLKRDFEKKTLVTKPSSKFFRMNVKLFMDFPNGKKYMASGIMIKENFVLTAGHNLYDEKMWAKRVRVIPAYNSGKEPFGSAEQSAMWVHPKWEKGQSHRYDFGVIKVNRNFVNVGYKGVYYESNTDNYLTKVFQVCSYPGERMYTRKGTFDVWGITNHLAGFMTVMQGGESGSCFFSSVGGSVGLIYTGNINGQAYAVAMTPGKVGYIEGWLKKMTPKFDLTPLYVNVISKKESDNSKQKMAYLVHNRSEEEWSGDVFADVYLSNNNNISTSDTLIQQHRFFANFTASSSVVVNVPSIKIPEGLSCGKYYIGVVLKIEDDIPANNDSDGDDTSEIEI